MSSSTATTPSAMFDAGSDRYHDREGRVHDHSWPDHTGRSGCNACEVRIGRVPIGWVDRLGYVWCVPCADALDILLPNALGFVHPDPAYANNSALNNEPCERCGRRLNTIPLPEPVRVD